LSRQTWSQDGHPAVFQQSSDCVLDRRNAPRAFTPEKGDLEMGLGLRKLPGSDLFVSAIDDWFIPDSVPLIKAAFLAQH
jgi:hypothetical protein